MKNILNAATPAPQYPLHRLVNDLNGDFANVAERNNVTIVNEIPIDIFVAKQDDKVVLLIKGLLNTVISNGKNTRVHVSADRFRDIIILNIQDRNNNNGYAMSFSVMSYEPEATAAGGWIHIEGQQKKIATVSFSFPNPAFAA